MAARTAAPAEPDAAPAPTPTRTQPTLRPDSPVLAWPAEWPIPQPPKQSAGGRRSGRGVPMAPALAAAGNATTITATAAYEAAGVAGLAATGVAVVASGVAAVARRRRTVQRNLSQRAARALGDNSRRSGGADGLRSGGAVLSPGSRGGGSLLSPAKNGRSDSAYRPGGASGGLPATGSGNARTTPGGHRSGGLGDKPGRRKKDKDDRGGLSGGGKSAGLKAAAGRTVRDAVKPGSKPRKALAAVGHGAAGVARGGIHAAKAARLVAKKAWTADRTKRIRERAKKLRGAGTDGLRALVAAAWAGLRKRSPRAAVARLREVWARRRKKRADKNTEKTETADAPVVADAVRRPTPTAVPATFAPQGAVMPGHHFVAPAMEMARIAANYDPQGMLQVGEDFSGLEEALRLTAEAMKVTVENADARFPLAPQITEQMRQIHALQLKAAELASELRPAFEQLHQVDLERLRNPRKGAAGERMWDVSTNLY